MKAYENQAGMYLFTEQVFNTSNDSVQLQTFWGNVQFQRTKSPENIIRRILMSWSQSHKKYAPYFMSLFDE